MRPETPTFMELGKEDVSNLRSPLPLRIAFAALVVGGCIAGLVRLWNPPAPSEPAAARPVAAGPPPARTGMR